MSNFFVSFVGKTDTTRIVLVYKIFEVSYLIKFPKNKSAINSKILILIRVFMCKIKRIFFPQVKFIFFLDEFNLDVE